MKAVVMDFGGSAIKYSVMDEKGNQEKRSEVVAPRTMEDFKSATKKIVDEIGEGTEGLTVSFPGFVQLDGRLTGGGAFPFLHGHNLIDEFKVISGFNKVTVENDGKCGALAEAWDGPLSDVDSGVVIIIGSALAGGLVKERKLIKNKHCTAGELSTVFFDPNDMDPSAYAMSRSSANSLVQRVANAKGYYTEAQTSMSKLYHFPLPELTPDPAYEGVVFDGKKVFEMLAEGDKDAVESYEILLSGMAALCLNLQTIYSPDRICIGGGISRQERLIPDIRNRCYEMLISMAKRRGIPTDNFKPFDNMDVEIVSCKYTGDANQYGAMYNYLLNFNPDLI